MYFKQKNLGTLHSCKDLKDNTLHIFYKDQIYKCTNHTDCDVMIL